MYEFCNVLPSNLKVGAVCKGWDYFRHHSRAAALFRPSTKVLLIVLSEVLVFFVD
jgi:hypothetical protein